MSNPIPPFDHNLVLPPHKGNPTIPADLSPYQCTTFDLCDRFATTSERIRILTGFLEFRKILRANGLKNAIQWLDGSFLEDVETRDGRDPRDLDLVTIYWGYDQAFQNSLMAGLPEFANSMLSKQRFLLDHYPFDATYNPLFTVDYTRYWVQLFSHNRNGVWKGMLSISLDTEADDLMAANFLKVKNLMP